MSRICSMRGWDEKCQHKLIMIGKPVRKIQLGISRPISEYDIKISLSRVGVIYKTGFGLDDWIYCTLYIHTFRDYRHYSAIAILHTFRFIVAHALGFSVFSSRILANGIYHSITVTSNHT
jgi:hypothetical protein